MTTQTVRCKSPSQLTSKQSGVDNLAKLFKLFLAYLQPL